MRKINELIYDEQSVWNHINNWINESNNKIEVLPVDTSKSQQVLNELQITTKSYLGAVVYHTAGILVQQGWLRILGSGTNKFQRNISSWNKINVDKEEKRLEGVLLIADDVMGGFFALNGGVFNGELGNVFYLAPDTIEWEDLDLKYPEFINWAITGDLDGFYETFRWLGWEKDIHKTTSDHGILVYPFLWVEGEEIEKRVRKVVPIEELWGMTIENRKKLGIV